MIKTATRKQSTLKTAKLPDKETKTAKSEQFKLVRSLFTSTVIKILLLNFPITIGKITLLTVNPMSISFLFIPFVIKVPKIMKLKKGQNTTAKKPQAQTRKKNPHGKLSKTLQIKSNTNLQPKPQKPHQGGNPHETDH